MRLHCRIPKSYDAQYTAALLPGSARSQVDSTQSAWVHELVGCKSCTCTRKHALQPLQSYGQVPLPECGTVIRRQLATSSVAWCGPAGITKTVFVLIQLETWQWLPWIDEDPLDDFGDDILVSSRCQKRCTNFV